MAKRQKTILGKALLLKEWLGVVLSHDPERVFPWNCFPTREMLEQYLATINERLDSEIKDLLRRFLMNSGTKGCDRGITQMLLEGDLLDLIERHEHFRRAQRGEAWEGITWVLDLLPRYPRKALDVLDHYFYVECQFFTDQMLDGHADAMAIIRAKYINSVAPNEVLLEIGPSKFETLAASLYQAMQYEVESVGGPNDEGRDLVLTRRRKGERQRLIVQCKCSKHNIGPAPVRELLGRVSDDKASEAY